MKEESKKYLEKAESSLELANKLYQQVYYADACSKAYYSMLYCSQALLRNEGVNLKKHSSVVSKLGEHFVKPGRLDKQYHKYIISAKKYREISDYDVYALIESDTAGAQIENAEKFLTRCKQLLSE